MQPQPYPSDLSDEEWSILAPLLVPGRPAARLRAAADRRRGILPLAHGLPVARPAARVPALADRLDGLFTTGKFCLTRSGRLALPWRRGALRTEPPPPSADAAVPGGPRP